MEQSRRSGDPARDEMGTDRRAFLRGLAALGGGAVMAASAAEAAPPRGLKATRAIGRVSRTNLGLKSGMKLVTAGQPKPIPAEMQPVRVPVQGAIPSPSTRVRLLKAMSGDAEGGATLQLLGINANALSSASLSSSLQVMSGDSLAQAYSQGIVLTPLGCEYAEGSPVPSDPPMIYWSYNGNLTPETVTAQQCSVHAPQMSEGEPAIWFGFIKTPGDPTTKMAYMLELSINSVFNNYLSRIKFSLNMSDFQFSQTSDNTLVATVELIGCGNEAYRHMLCVHARQYQIAGFGFNWLNVMAL